MRDGALVREPDEPHQLAALRRQLRLYRILLLIALVAAIGFGCWLRCARLPAARER